MELQLKSLHDDLSKAIEQVSEGKPLLLRLEQTPVAALIAPADLELLQRYIAELEDQEDLEALRESQAENTREGTVPYEVFRKELGL